MEILELLRRWEMFSHVPDEQLTRLAGCASAVVSLPTGALVVREGERSRGVYLLCSGTVCIQRKTPYGLFVLACLGPGSLFGEIAFVDRGPRAADAVTTTAGTELVVFDSDALDAACQTDEHLHLALSWLLWKSISAKLRQTSENLSRVFEGSAPHAANRTLAEVSPGRDVSVGLATKRTLFAEMNLSGPETNILASLSREKAFSPNQVIFREGDSAGEMYVVLTGKVMISKFIPGAGEEALAFLERGGLFGQLALTDDEPRSADAKAHGDGAVVLAIPREVLEDLLGVHEVSSLRLLNLLCSQEARRLRQLNERLVTWFILANGSGISWPVEASRP